VAGLGADDRVVEGAADQTLYVGDVGEALAGVAAALRERPPQIDVHGAARVAVVVDGVYSVAAIDRVVALVGRSAGRHVDGVVARAAEDRVASAAAVEIVIAGIAGQPVVEAVALAAEVA